MIEYYENFVGLDEYFSVEDTHLKIIQLWGNSTTVTCKPINQEFLNNIDQYHQTGGTSFRKIQARVFSDHKKTLSPKDPECYKKVLGTTLHLLFIDYDNACVALEFSKCHVGIRIFTTPPDTSVYENWRPISYDYYADQDLEFLLKYDRTD